MPLVALEYKLVIHRIIPDTIRTGTTQWRDMAESLIEDRIRRHGTVSLKDQHKVNAYLEEGYDGVAMWYLNEGLEEV